MDHLVQNVLKFTSTEDAVRWNIEQMSENERYKLLKPFVDRHEKLIEKDKQKWKDYRHKMQLYSRNPQFDNPYPSRPHLKYWNPY